MENGEPDETHVSLIVNGKGALNPSSALGPAQRASLNAQASVTAKPAQQALSAGGARTSTASTMPTAPTAPRRVLIEEVSTELLPPRVQSTRDTRQEKPSTPRSDKPSAHSSVSVASGDVNGAHAPLGVVEKGSHEQPTSAKAHKAKTEETHPIDAESRKPSRASKVKGSTNSPSPSPTSSLTNLKPATTKKITCVQFNYMLSTNRFFLSFIGKLV